MARGSWSTFSDAFGRVSVTGQDGLKHLILDLIRLPSLESLINSSGSSCHLSAE